MRNLYSIESGDRFVLGRLSFLLVFSLCMPNLLCATDRLDLVEAVKQKADGKIAKLLESKHEINAQHKDGMTALHWAVFQDDAKRTRVLLEAGADPKIANRYSVFPLSTACTNGSAEVVELLLKSGADPNVSLPGNESALHTAARTGSAECVALLLEAGAEPNAKDRKGQTPLMWAAAAGNGDAVSELLNCGAKDVSLRSGFNSLYFAVREGHLDTVLRLIESGVEFKSGIEPAKTVKKGLNKGTTPFMLAVENGHFELALKLLDLGADVHDQSLGYTALHALVWVRKPIRGDGDPPPIGSGKVGSLDFARALLERGAKVDARHKKASAPNLRLNKTDATPLFLAADTADLSYIRLLMEYGADPNAMNSEKTTPLLAAAGVGVIGNGDETAGTEEEAIETMQFLLEHGADINAVDELGKTAMHGAAFKSWIKVIDFLSKQGADVIVWNTKMKRGWTPLKIAQGHRPGNFRPSAETIVAIENAMKLAGVQPPIE